MARVCEICKKSSQKGKKIKLIWGVKYRSIRHQQPNLQKTTLMVDCEPVGVRICTNCLKSVKQGKYAGIKPLPYTTQKYTQPHEPFRNSSH